MFQLLKPVLRRSDGTKDKQPTDARINKPQIILRTRKEESRERATATRPTEKKGKLKN